MSKTIVDWFKRYGSFKHLEYYSVIKIFSVDVYSLM